MDANGIISHFTRGTGTNIHRQKYTQEKFSEYEKKPIYLFRISAFSGFYFGCLFFTLRYSISIYLATSSIINASSMSPT